MALLLNIGGTKDAYLISYDFPWFKHNQLEQTIVVAYKAYSESASSNNSARLLTFGHYQSNSREYLDLNQNWTSAGGTDVPSARFNTLSNPSLPSGYNSGNDRLLAINSYYAGSGLRLMATSVELENDLQVMYTANNKLRAYNHSELVNIAENLTIGTLNEDNVFNRVWLGEIYYVAVLNRPLQSTELQSIAAGDVMLLDDYRSNLYELWDFGKAERDEAFVGLISGTVMDAIGTAWSLTGESKYPVSRDTPSCIHGQLGTSIHDAPAWLSTLDSPAAGSETINCTAADLALSGHGAGLVELSVIECSAGAVSVGGELCAVYQAQVISCSTGALALSAAAAQQVEVGDSVISCSTAALTLSAAAAQQVEVGDSVIGCVAAALTLTTPSAQQLESGDSVISCATASLTLAAAVAQQIEVGDNAISCSTASLTLTTTTAQQLEVGDSVIGCAATIVSLDGTTATITDSMGVRSAAVVLSTPGCSIHDFDIIGAGQAALVTGSSAAELVESGETLIGTGYADIGIAAAQCGIVQTDAEPIITDIGLVASIDQPTIYATIPLITIIARS